jgi:hypothetical protein
MSAPDNLLPIHDVADVAGQAAARQPPLLRSDIVLIQHDPQLTWGE